MPGAYKAGVATRKSLGILYCCRELLYFLVVPVTVYFPSIDSYSTIIQYSTRNLYMVHVLLSLQWRYNDHDGVSNHKPHGCLLNHLFGRRLKKTSKLRVTGLCAGNSPGPVNSPHKGPVTRKMFPFDDVIMVVCCGLVPIDFTDIIQGYLMDAGIVLDHILT